MGLDLRSRSKSRVLGALGREEWMIGRDRGCRQPESGCWSNRHQPPTGTGFMLTEPLGLGLLTASWAGLQLLKFLKAGLSPWGRGQAAVPGWEVEGAERDMTVSVHIPGLYSI